MADARRIRNKLLPPFEYIPPIEAWFLSLLLTELLLLFFCYSFKKCGIILSLTGVVFRLRMNK